MIDEQVLRSVEGAVREAGGFGGFAVQYAGLFFLSFSAESAAKMQIAFLMTVYSSVRRRCGKAR